MGELVLMWPGDTYSQEMLGRIIGYDARANPDVLLHDRVLIRTRASLSLPWLAETGLLLSRDEGLFLSEYREVRWVTYGYYHLFPVSWHPLSLLDHGGKPAVIQPGLYLVVGGARYTLFPLANPLKRA